MPEPNLQVKKLQNLNLTADLIGYEHTDNVMLTADNLQRANEFQMAEGQRLSAEEMQIKELRDTIVNQLMILEDVEKEEIRQSYPSLITEMEEKKQAIVDTANLSGKNKLKKDFFTFGRKRANARKRLNAISAATGQWKNAKKEERKKTGYLEERVWDKRVRNPRHSYESNNNTGRFAQFMVGIFNKDEEDRRLTHNTVPDESLPEDHIFKDRNYQATPVEIKGRNNSTLRGYRFEPEREKSNGKTVIIYGGSGDAGLMEQGMGTNIRTYVDQGYRVFQVDYRGYGESGIRKDDGTFEPESLTERKFYEDGVDILKGVKKELGCNYSDIVLHGYSMGGAIASYVAAKLAKKKAEQRSRGNAQGKDTLGGLVMDSAMKSMFYAARGSTFWLGGYVAKWTIGKYSAKDHLENLNQYEPDIPILFVSGDTTAKDYEGKPDPDGLALSDTKLEETGKFINKKVYVKRNSSHYDSHINGNLVAQLNQRMEARKNWMQ